MELKAKRGRPTYRVQLEHQGTTYVYTKANTWLPDLAKAKYYLSADSARSAQNGLKKNRVFHTEGLPFQGLAHKVTAVRLLDRDKPTETVPLGSPEAMLASQPKSKNKSKLRPCRAALYQLGTPDPAHCLELRDKRLREFRSGVHRRRVS